MRFGRDWFQVYVPVAVTMVRADDGGFVPVQAQVDWEGAPWMFVMDEGNVWNGAEWVSVSESSHVADADEAAQRYLEGVISVKTAEAVRPH